MCSITAILKLNGEGSDLRKEALEISKRQRHRGPDWSGVFQHENALLVHERLAIVDVSSGAQPLIDAETGTALAVNGEIYNHNHLRSKSETFPYKTGSDCEVILALYREKGRALVNELEGMFAFVLYDKREDSWLIGRDPIGIIPLFYGHDHAGRLYVASEMKALSDICDDVLEFPPGCTFQTGDAQPVRYFKEDWMDFDTLPNLEYKPEELKSQLEDAVKSHLMGDVPYGLLISGGLDSSVIASIAKKFSSKRVDDDGKTDAWWPSIHSFCIGLKGSPDLAAAQKVADAIGTVHHSLVFTIQCLFFTNRLSIMR